MISNYYNLKGIASRVAAQKHRAIIGGLWDEVGSLQFRYLVEDGLTPEMRLLDIGCGCLRGGIHFVEHLAPGHYYGLDMSQALLDAGYDVELAQLGLQERLPRSNLFCTSDFDMSAIDQQVDAAIALSVFTHLPLNHVRMCLARLAGVMKVGGKFYATVFTIPESADWTVPLEHNPGGVVTHPIQDPYHYRPEDMDHACSGLGWEVERLVDWNHPRNQKMCVFKRI